MPLVDLLSNILAIIIFLGGPIIPLLILAIQIARWHDQYAE